MEIKIRKDIVKTDYLIIGGGVAGLQSAITAAALGVDVLIAFHFASPFPRACSHKGLQAA